MKKIIVALTLLVSATSAFAGTSVAWYFGYGMYPHGASDLVTTTPGTGVAAVNSVTWQLVWAGADNTIDIVDASNSGLGYVSDDDVVLQTRTTAAGGDASFDEWLYNADIPAWYETSTTYGGYAYIRVFQDTTPANGEWYYNSGTVALNNIDTTNPLRTPDFIDGNPSTTAGNALNVQIVPVPEPSTVGLLLVGVGLIAARRFRRG